MKHPIFAFLLGVVTVLMIGATTNNSGLYTPTMRTGNKMPDGTTNMVETVNAGDPSRVVRNFAQVGYSNVTMFAPSTRYISHDQWMEEQYESHLRDQFAGQAMQGLLSGNTSNWWIDHKQMLVESSFQTSDIMMAERAKRLELERSK